MALPQLPKLMTRVRFPLAAPHFLYPTQDIPQSADFGKYFKAG